MISFFCIISFWLVILGGCLSNCIVSLNSEVCFMESNVLWRVVQWSNCYFGLSHDGAC